MTLFCKAQLLVVDDNPTNQLQGSLPACLHHETTWQLDDIYVDHTVVLCFLGSFYRWEPGYAADADVQI